VLCVSGFQEWNHGASNIFKSELEMVTVNLLILDLSSLGEVLKTDEVLVVEVSSVEWEHVVMGVQGLEPGGLLWVDHGVLGEHHEHTTVDGRESLLSQSGIIARGSFLVIHGGEEYRIFLVNLEVVYISKVSGWDYPILGDAHINKLLGSPVDNVTEDTGQAVRNGINSHVWTSSSENVSNLSGHVTFLSNMSGEKSSLRKTDDVEFTLEVLMFSDLLAALFSDVLDVVDNLTN